VSATLYFTASNQANANVVELLPTSGVQPAIISTFSDESHTLSHHYEDILELYLRSHNQTQLLNHPRT